MEDLIDPIALEEDIITSYSLTPEDIPDENIDPVVPIRPAQALAAIQTLRDWEFTAGRQYPGGCQATPDT
jgi:hypothetical protein